MRKKEKMNVRKTVKMILLVLALFMFICFSERQVQAKSQKYYVNKFVKYYKAGKCSKARKNYEKLKKYASEKCVKKMPKKMKKAYRRVLKKYQEYDLILIQERL